MTDSDFVFFTQKLEECIGLYPFLLLELKKSTFLAPKWPPKVLAKIFWKILLLTFLLIAPSIFIQFSSVIPFWKAEGLTSMVMPKIFWDNFGPMRNQHLKIGHPRGHNFFVPVVTKKWRKEKFALFICYFRK